MEFRKYRPRLVIGLGDKTPMASPDHWQAMQITDAAVFYSRLTKWDEQFEDLPVAHDRPAALLHAGPAAFRRADAAGRAVVVDISDTLERKIAAIRCYKTQFPPEKEHLFERVDRGRPLPGPLGRRRGGRDAHQPAAGGDEDLMAALFE